MQRTRNKSKTKARKKVVKQIREHKHAQASRKIDTKLLIPSGSTLLNLACSDNPFGAFGRGTMVNIVGDRSSGKTMEGITVLAEMAQKKRFRRYKLKDDDIEAANRFDLTYLFGKRLASRIEMSEPSDTTEELFSRLMKLLEGKNPEPFAYLLDSFDALTSIEEQLLVKAALDAQRKGQKAKGSYGMQKPKLASQLFRMICRKLEKSKSFLMVISQTRDNINAASFKKKNRSGGRALEFYATHEIWLAVVERIVKGARTTKAGGKTFKKGGHVVGIICRAKVTKNKLTGKERTVDFPLYYDYGVDDVGSCVDFMVKEKFWPKKKNTIQAKGLRISGTRQSIIKRIEDNGMEKEMRKLVGKAWNKIEDGLKSHRKRKYQ